MTATENTYKTSLINNRRYLGKPLEYLALTTGAGVYSIPKRLYY